MSYILTQEKCQAAIFGDDNQPGLINEIVTLTSDNPSTTQLSEAHYKANELLHVINKWVCSLNIRDVAPVFLGQITREEIEKALGVELHYGTTQDFHYGGPRGTMVYVSAYRSRFYGYSRRIAFSELPVEIMDADEETFLAHPWTITNLVSDAIENLEAHIASAFAELELEK